MTSPDDLFGPRLQQIRAQNQQEQNAAAAAAAAFATAPQRLAQQIEFLQRRLTYKQVPTSAMPLGYPTRKEIEDPTDKRWRRSKRRTITVVAKPAPTVEVWSFNADKHDDWRGPSGQGHVDVALTRDGALYLMYGTVLHPPDLKTLPWAGPGQPLPHGCSQWLTTSGDQIFVGQRIEDPDQPYNSHGMLSDSLAQWYATLM